MIRSRIALPGSMPQVTSSSSYYQQLASRFTDQARQRVPRSEASWGAEKNRLGSWETGVGVIRPSGLGIARPNGATDPRFYYDAEADDKETQR